MPMYTCDRHPRSIVIYERACPACEAEDKVTELWDEIEKLQKELEGESDT